MATDPPQSYGLFNVKSDPKIQMPMDRNINYIPLPVLIGAHSKFSCPGLNAAAHHQSVSRFEDVQRARHSRVGHRANKYGNVFT